MEYPINKIRTLFDLAPDVSDARLQKAFTEADRLDLKPQIKVSYANIPAKYVADTDMYIGAEMILCYYAYARYLEVSEMESTGTGVKIQNWSNTIMLPDNSKAKRFEAEKQRADLFCFDLIQQMKIDGFIKDPISYNSRICLIQ